MPKPEVLVDYYRSLVERSEGYRIEEKNRDIDMKTADHPPDDLGDSGDVASRSKPSQ